MTVVSSCPDSLLGRARAGTLSSAERRQLHDHIGQCETCRINLLVGHDFDGTLAARADDTLLVARVVDAVRASVAAHTSSAPTKRVARPKRLIVYGIAATLLTISCVVGASRPAVRRSLAVLLGFQEVRTNTVPVETMPRDVPKRSPGESSITTLKVPEMPLALPDEPMTPPRSTEVVHAESPPPHGATAKDLFAQANARRRAGDEAGAKRLYQELQQRHPQSPEAEVSRVALGRLLLERWQDPKAALEQFDRALASGPSDQAGLAEEALFGRATALMRLGRANEERKTWLQLLERFAGSVYADRAHSRLDELTRASGQEGSSH